MEELYGFCYVSDEIMFLLEGNETIRFSRSSLRPSILPTEEQLQKKVLGIQLSYAFCGEQDFGIEPMRRAFGAGSNGIIKKIPKDFKLETYEDVYVLKYGSTILAPEMIPHTREVGAAGYWDDANLIICCSKKYEKLIKNIAAFIQPKKAKFAFRTLFSKPNLMILSV